MDLADYLIEELKKRRMKPAELARLAGIDKGIISRALARKRRPSPESLVAIARGLKIPSETLFRIAGPLPLDTLTDRRVRELVHLSGDLPDAALEEVLEFARLRLNLAEKRGEYNEKKRLRSSGAG